MSKTNWNKGQLNAINVDTKNILVSAGAGSGKTSVLSERVIEKLKTGRQINRFLILTFTNAAAAEMKERIRNKILKTKGLENQIAKKYFVTRQTVASIIRTCGFSGEDRKRVTSDMVLAILDAQKSGLSSEEIVAKYAVKKEND